MAFVRGTNNSTVVSLEQQTNLIREMPGNEPSNRPGAAVNNGSRSPEGAEAEEAPLLANDGQAEDGGEAEQDMQPEPVALGEHELFRRQQQWLLGLQQMNYGQMGPYGNFMPNFPMGILPQVPQWGCEEEVNPEPTGGLATRQGAHEISDDEDDDVAQVVPGVAEPPKDQEVINPSKGKTSSLVKGILDQAKEAQRMLPKTNEEVALLLDQYLKDAVLVSDMEKLAKKYPRVENCERMTVQRLDTEVFQVVEQHVRTADQNMQGIQKGLLGAMAAFAPILGLVFDRKDTDPELDELGQNIVEGFQLLALANNALVSKRRDMLKPHLAPIYAKVMSKGQEDSTEWLYGGNLVETTKQCEVAKRIGEKVVKRKQQFPLRGKFQPTKRFKAPFPAMMLPTQPMLRAFNPFQMGQVRFPNPQMMQQSYQYPSGLQQPGGYGFPQQNSYGFPRRPRFNKPRQGFGKRGNSNK